MPTVDPPASPTQTRARRIRATVLTLSALATVVILLTVAWLAYTATRRLPPTRLQPSIPAEGHLTFDVATILDATIGSVVPEDRRGRVHFAREANALRAGFARRGEVWYWLDGERECWLLHVPFRKPQRYFHEKVRNILITADKTGLVSIGGAPTGESRVTGWWQLRPTGLLICSEPHLPPFSILPQPVPGSEQALYTTATDHVPSAWEAFLPPEDLDEIRAGVLLSARWHAAPTESAVSVFSYQLEGGSGDAVWFQPLYLSPPEAHP